jgi:hypothetical protein
MVYGRDRPAGGTAEAVSGNVTPTGIWEVSPATQRRRDSDGPGICKYDGENKAEGASGGKMIDY